MIAIGYQRGTTDLAPDADAKDRDSLVAEEADHRGKRNRPQVMNILRMKETVDAFVPGDDSAGKDGKEYRQTSQVLYPTIPKCKTAAWVLARE